MKDKVGIKTAPKTAISIRIEITPTDIRTLLQTALTGEEIPENDTETIQKNQARRTPNEIYKK